MIKTIHVVKINTFFEDEVNKALSELSDKVKLIDIKYSGWKDSDDNDYFGALIIYKEKK